MNSSKIKEISLAIGKSCFLRCSGCYNHFSPNALIDRDKVIIFTRFLKENYGLKKVTLCGGDPLSRPDILEILSYLKGLGLTIHLDTTGVPLFDDAKIIYFGTGIVKRIPLDKISGLIDVMGLPLDGPDDIVNRFFREGRRGYISEVIHLISNLNHLDQNICINTVVHKNNSNSLTQIADIIAPLNVTTWQLFQFAPTGPIGYANRNKFYITEKDFDRSIKQLKTYITANKIKIQIEGKSISRRKDNYLLVDSSGDIWCPKKTVSGRKWGPNLPTNKERVIFGNIKESTNFNEVINSAILYRS